MQQITIPRSMYDAMVTHAREGFPNEICGVILGPPGEMRELHRARNSAADPLYTYDIDPKDLLRLYERADETGWDFVAIYHSHPPFAEVFPSATDIAKAFHPDAIYIILAIGRVPAQMREQLRNPEGRAALIRQFGDIEQLEPRLRAYRIIKEEVFARSGQVQEVEITVV
jgi:proteasome lid subunit RPN8/RPN11